MFRAEMGNGRKSMKLARHLALLLALAHISCADATKVPDKKVDDVSNEAGAEPVQPAIQPGIFQFFGDVESMGAIRFAVVANHTSLINGVHLVDSMLSAGLNVQRIFAPEHGFRGNVADGEAVSDERDPKTGLPVVSLYGKNKKPQQHQLEGIDVLVFDIQDVGARFYTFLSTMHYAMEACASQGIKVMVLDRPNPNIHYVDGPVLQSDFSSFVGLHPVPVVYGMSIGEYALMVNGEGWLKDGLKCDLQIVPCANYSRDSRYVLPVAPSPNLPDMKAIYLYPSLCFFEGTSVSVGRGTPTPFTVIGEPANTKGKFTFIPASIPGVSENPPQKGLLCKGYDLGAELNMDTPIDSIHISWLVQMYRETSKPETFFLTSGFIDKLAGTDQLRKAVVAGLSAGLIRASWKPDLDAFKEKRKPYLIYP
jgi:uncharacterized protein YbbC (DUF1343 family)